ncbi:MAG: hypothetical protein WAW88_02700 [Nocardioides sp.]
MEWSVTLIADGDRPMSREEIVELADAVAPFGGVASGIGTPRYGAQIIVTAPHRDAAVQAASDAFSAAAARAGLPAWPISSVETISAAEDELDDVFADDTYPPTGAP